MELLEALKRIKFECLNHQDCGNCPLHSPSSSVNCQIIKITPNGWQFVDKDEKPSSIFVD